MKNMNKIYDINNIFKIKDKINFFDINFYACDINETIEDLAKIIDTLYEVVAISGISVCYQIYTFDKTSAINLAENLVKNHWLSLFENNIQNTNEDKIMVMAYTLKEDWDKDVECFSNYNIIRMYKNK